MEARIDRTAGRAALRRTALLAAVLLVAMGARQRTDNFIVETADPNFAQQMAQAAEKYRHDLAIEWLGKPMPNWAQPCVMEVRVGPNLGAGGATTFVFDHGEVFNWRMSIQGSPERLLDSVLPHEVTHTIFASQFRQPLPRWADEGGATSVEHASEKNKYRQMLNQFLRTGHGIAFSRMFAMTDYPADIMPLYAEGYSLAEYLIGVGGRRKYVEFLADGLQSDDWAGAVQRNYGAKDLGTLQNTWLAWVSQGMPPLKPREVSPAGDMLAAAPRRPRPEPNLIYHLPDQPAPAATPAALPASSPITTPGEMVPVHIQTPPDLAAAPAGEGSGVTAVAAAAPLRSTVAATGWIDPRPSVLPPAQLAAGQPRRRPVPRPIPAGVRPAHPQCRRASTPCRPKSPIRSRWSPRGKAWWGSSRRTSRQVASPGADRRSAGRRDVRSMNETLRSIYARHSVRLFTDQEVAEADVRAILDAANRAPSAHNQQSWRFIVLRGEKKHGLAELVGGRASDFPRPSSILLRMAARSITGAPVVVAVANTGELIRHGSELFQVDQQAARDFFRTMEIQSLGGRRRKPAPGRHLAGDRLRVAGHSVPDEAAGIGVSRPAGRRVHGRHPAGLSGKNHARPPQTPAGSDRQVSGLIPYIGRPGN